jgi:hypothetical protein
VKSQAGGEPVMLETVEGTLRSEWERLLSSHNPLLPLNTLVVLLRATTHACTISPLSSQLPSPLPSFPISRRVGASSSRLESQERRLTHGTPSKAVGTTGEATAQALRSKESSFLDDSADSLSWSPSSGAITDAIARFYSTMHRRKGLSGSLEFRD